jgi:hypothetical protein
MFMGPKMLTSPEGTRLEFKFKDSVYGKSFVDSF